VLLDALEAFGDQRSAVVLVGVSPRVSTESEREERRRKRDEEGEEDG
jgi:hypothetical protein